jgi:hypothetical protein
VSARAPDSDAATADQKKSIVFAVIFPSTLQLIKDAKLLYLHLSGTADAASLSSSSTVGSLERDLLICCTCLPLTGTQWAVNHPTVTAAGVTVGHYPRLRAAGRSPRLCGQQQSEHSPESVSATDSVSSPSSSRTFQASSHDGRRSPQWGQSVTDLLAVNCWGMGTRSGTCPNSLLKVFSSLRLSGFYCRRWQ